MKKSDAEKELAQLNERAEVLRKIIATPEITPKQRLLEMVSGCEIKIDLKHYLNSIFLFKGDKFFFEADFKNGDLWCSYKNCWEIFESEFGFKYNEIKELIWGLMEEHFKSKQLTPIYDHLLQYSPMEEHFKSKQLTPILITTITQKMMEEHFKSKQLTP